MPEGLGQRRGALGRAVAVWGTASTWQWCPGETSQPQARGSDWEEAQLYFRVDQRLLFHLRPSEADGSSKVCAGSRRHIFTLQCCPCAGRAREGWAFRSCYLHVVSAVIREVGHLALRAH